MSPSDGEAQSNPERVRREVKELLYTEAALLDHWQVEDWLQLFTPDCHYWVPITSDGPDPLDDLSLIYDDYTMLEDRALRLSSSAVHSQAPRTRTRRLISNIRIERLANDELRVSSYFTLHAARLDRELVLGGEYEHLLVYAETRWGIRRKKVLLVNSEAQLTNMTFLL